MEKHLRMNDAWAKAGADMEQGEGAEPVFATPRLGILTEDPKNYRLIEGLSAQLDASLVRLSEESVNVAIVEDFDLILADESVARRIRLTLRPKDRATSASPWVVAIRAADLEPIPGSNEPGDEEFEGILTLPQEPAAVLTQLSVILYAHRGYVRRFQSAMDELDLNRRIFRSVTNGITVADARLPDMPLVYVNPAFEVMTGYSFEEVQGKNCRFLQAAETDQPGLTLIREALKAERQGAAVLKNYRKNGTFFWNELYISPIRNRDGELTHVVGIQMDVTARVELEAALRESEKLAAVGRLAASIAHEINNPLESVMNLLYLAQHTESDAELRGYLKLADKELQRVALITSQSLRFYRQSTQPQVVRPTEMLESVLDVYQGKLTTADIRLEKRQRMSGSIVCLESEIRQVLSNLVRNAIDAMRATGGRLLVRSREATEWRSGARGVLLTVADTGTGISEETMKHPYRAFYTTKGMGGTGLGLWLSAEIVDRHHGRLRVRSSQQPGKSWTVFELFLPYQGMAS